MNLVDFCWKLYLWPLLANIAKYKGICNNNYIPTPFPYITLPPGATFPSTLPTFPTLPSSGQFPTGTGPALSTFPTLPPTG